MRLLKETGLSFLLKISQAGFSFLTTVLLARFLGAEGYGMYAYAFAFVTLFSIPAQAGLPQLVVRETARGMAEGKPEAVKGIWQWATKVVAIISVVLIIIIGSIFFLFKINKFGLKEWTFFWALLLVPFMCLSSLRGAALRGLHKVVLGQLPGIFIRPFLFLVFLCIGWFLFRQKLTPPQVMAFNVLAAALAFVVGTWLLYRNIPSSIYKVRPSCEGEKWFGSLIPLTFIAGMWLINSKVDIVILGFFRSPKEVGIYRVAIQIAMFSSFGLQAVNMVFAPRFTELYAKKKIAELQKLATLSARLSLAFNLCIAIPFILFGKSILNFIFGKNFILAYLPLLILLLGQFFNAIVGSVGTLLNMVGNEKDTAKGMAVATGINIIMNLLLIPFWGAKGAAVSTTIYMITCNFILWYLIKSQIGINSLAFLSY